MLPIQITILIYIGIFICGTIVGSFLNVCICRIPAKESVIKGRSHCMSCGSKLKWYEMIPVVSWMLLRGKCRSCGMKISSQYPLVELINGILWAVTFLICGTTWVSFIYCLAESALIVMSVIDWRIYEIPLGINGFIAICGAAVTILDGREAMLSHISGAFAISLPLFVLYILSGGNAVGGGDVKLMAATGLMLGAGKVIPAFILACLYGSIIHICRMKLSGEGSVLAMGPYLAAGSITAMWFGTKILDIYMGWIGF